MCQQTAEKRERESKDFLRISRVKKTELLKGWDYDWKSDAKQMVG